jgi:hypothetical protein
MKHGIALLAFAVPLLGAGLSPSPALAKCGKDCKVQIKTEFKACKAACPKAKAGKDCKHSCKTTKRGGLAACRVATNPTPPECGRTTIPTTTTTSIGATTSTTTSTGGGCTSAGHTCGGSVTCMCVPHCGVAGTPLTCISVSASGTSCSSDAQCSPSEQCIGSPIAGGCSTSPFCQPVCP